MCYSDAERAARMYSCLPGVPAESIQPPPSGCSTRLVAGIKLLSSDDALQQRRSGQLHILVRTCSCVVGSELRGV